MLLRVQAYVRIRALKVLALGHWKKDRQVVSFDTKEFVIFVGSEVPFSFCATERRRNVCLGDIHHRLRATLRDVISFLHRSMNILMSRSYNYRTTRFWLRSLNGWTPTLNYPLVLTLFIEQRNIYNIIMTSCFLIGLCFRFHKN